MNKLAIITGASRGQGAAIARRLASDGFTVGIHYGTDEEGAKNVLADIKGAGGEAFIFSADLAQLAVGEEFWAAVDAAYPNASHVDVLVNNAGVFTPGSIEKVGEDVLERNFFIHVASPYSIVRSGINRFSEGGSIVNTSSFAGVAAEPAALTYAASKAAQNSFTRSLAKYLAPRGIRVNGIAPGPTQNRNNSAMFEKNPKVREAMVARVPMGRIGQPEDIAKVVAFLASDESGWITGDIINVSGGVQLN